MGVRALLCGCQLGVSQNKPHVIPKLSSPILVGPYVGLPKLPQGPLILFHRILPQITILKNIHTHYYVGGRGLNYCSPKGEIWSERSILY